LNVKYEDEKFDDLDRGKIQIGGKSTHLMTWASADFFLGEGKNFPGGQEPTFYPKTTKKIQFFQKKKNLKTYYFWPALAGQGGGARASPCLPLRTPMPDDK
jgi:hypothetical protein